MKYTVESVNSLGKNANVFLDDVQFYYVIEADTDLGYIDFYPREDNGDFRFANDEELLVERKFGKVRVDIFDK